MTEPKLSLSIAMFTTKPGHQVLHLYIFFNISRECDPTNALGNLWQGMTILSRS